MIVFEYEFITDQPQALNDMLAEAFKTGNLGPVLALFEG